MKYINKFKTTTEFEAVKEQLQELEHYLVYDEETDEIYLKMPPEKSYTLNYKITQDLISLATSYDNKLPLITRCDLFKSIKVDGMEQDLSGKARTPYEFNGTTADDIEQEIQSLMFTTDLEWSETFNEDYVLTTSDLVEDKEGTIEVVWQDNIPLKSLISCMYYNALLTDIPNDMFINKQFTNLIWMFTQCMSLSSLDLSSFDTSQVTDMNNMFNYCQELTSLDLSNFDTSQVTDMNNMFNYCTKLTSLDLSSFDTSQVTDMFNMFYYCAKLTSLKLSSFDTSKVTDMNNMFYNCAKLTSLDLNSFNTSNVTNMRKMFDVCLSLASLDLSSFDTSQVTDMFNMFDNCPKLTSLDLSSFDTSKVTTMYNMFAYCSSLTSLDLSSFDTSKVTSMGNMFNKCTSLTQITCKQLFKDWCLTNQSTINLPTAMQEGGSGQWKIVD